MPEELDRLKEENERLKELIGFKSDLVSISVHQLRTALAATKWSLKMLLDGDLGELPREAAEQVRRSYESNERLIAMAGEILSINHSEGIDPAYHFEETDLSSLMEEAVLEFKDEAFKHRMRIEYVPVGTPAAAEVDRPLFKVVMQNLLENAIKYGAPDTAIAVSVEPQGDSVLLSVQDAGIGIAEADKHKIFSKFYRADAAKQKESIGSGLGLFTTRNIVERHGGKIWFESQEGEGTTFFVSVPVRQP